MELVEGTFTSLERKGKERKGDTISLGDVELWLIIFLQLNVLDGRDSFK